MPIRYREALLSILVHVSLIPISHKTPRAYRVHLSKLSKFLHVSLIPIRHNRRSTYQSHSSATEHSSAYKNHFHNLQPAKCFSVTEESYWATLIHGSLNLISHNRPSSHHSQGNSTELSCTMKFLSPTTTGLVPNSYREALLSTLTDRC
jgi:hypothetical protein